MSLQHHHRHRSIMEKLTDKVILGSMIVSNNGFNGTTAGVSTGTPPTASTAISTAMTTATTTATACMAVAGNRAANSTAPGPKKKKVIRKVVMVRKARKLKSEVAKEKEEEKEKGRIGVGVMKRMEDFSLFIYA